MRMSPQTPEERQRMERVPYASVVESLICIMLCIRPYIAYMVSVISKYQSNLGEEYWVTVKHIMKYLQRTMDMVLAYGRGDHCVEGFTDLDFQFDVDDRKSTSGYIFDMNGGAISWICFK